MAFERYACFVYADNEEFTFDTTDIIEAAMWCTETFFEKFDDSRFICAHCLYLDTESGPVYFPFAFHRNGSLVVDDDNNDWCFVFDDVVHDEKLVSLQEFVDWVLSTVKK